LIERAIVRIAGTGETALRMFPFVCSVAALIAFWFLARKKLTGVAQVAAVCIFFYFTELDRG
jgi:hypothetical protein